MRGIRYKDFRPITRGLSVQKRVSENTVLCIKHNFQLKLVCSIHSVALLNITLFKSKKFFNTRTADILIPFALSLTTQSQSFFSMVGHKHLPNRIARFFLCKIFRTVSAFRHSRALLSPTLNSLPASRFPFSFATSTTSSLNLAVYDFLRELLVLPPSMGNSDANF